MQPGVLLGGKLSHCTQALFCPQCLDMYIPPPLLVDPATIFIDVSDECTASAGATYGRVVAPGVGLPVTLCCGVDGFPEPTQSWSQIIINEDGVATERILNTTG